MPPAEAAQILFDHGHDIYEPWQDPRPMYGRWSMGPTPGGNGHTLEIYKEPGRGRFKIMVADIYESGEDKVPGPLHSALLITHGLFADFYKPYFVLGFYLWRADDDEEGVPRHSSRSIPGH
jgi:hypothetical protein